MLKIKTEKPRQRLRPESILTDAKISSHHTFNQACALFPTVRSHPRLLPGPAIDMTLEKLLQTAALREHPSHKEVCHDTESRCPQMFGVRLHRQRSQRWRRRSDLLRQENAGSNPRRGQETLLRPCTTGDSLKDRSYLLVEGRRWRPSSLPALSEGDSVCPHLATRTRSRVWLGLFTDGSRHLSQGDFEDWRSLPCLPRISPGPVERHDFSHCYGASSLRADFAAQKPQNPIVHQIRLFQNNAMTGIRRRPEM